MVVIYIARVCLVLYLLALEILFSRKWLAFAEVRHLNRIMPFYLVCASTIFQARGRELGISKHGTVDNYPALGEF